MSITKETLLEWKEKAKVYALTLDDSREIVSYLRQGRAAAAAASEKAKKAAMPKAKKDQLKGEDLLKQLEADLGGI